MLTIEEIENNTNEQFYADTLKRSHIEALERIEELEAIVMRLGGVGELPIDRKQADESPPDAGDTLAGNIAEMLHEMGWHNQSYVAFHTLEEDIDEVLKAHDQRIRAELIEQVIARYFQEDHFATSRKHLRALASEQGEGSTVPDREAGSKEQDSIPADSCGVATVDAPSLHARLKDFRNHTATAAKKISRDYVLKHIDAILEPTQASEWPQPDGPAYATKDHRTDEAKDATIAELREQLTDIYGTETCQQMLDASDTYAKQCMGQLAALKEAAKTVRFAYNANRTSAEVYGLETRQAKLAKAVYDMETVLADLPAAGTALLEDMRKLHESNRAQDGLICGLREERDTALREVGKQANLPILDHECIGNYMDMETGQPYPCPHKEPTQTSDRILHVLWTKAVGTEGYDKQEWKELERIVHSAVYPQASDEPPQEWCECDREMTPGEKRRHLNLCGECGLAIRERGREAKLRGEAEAKLLEVEGAYEDQTGALELCIESENALQAKLDTVGKLLQEKIDAYGGQGNNTVAEDFHEVLMELE